MANPEIEHGPEKSVNIETAPNRAEVLDNKPSPSPENQSTNREQIDKIKTTVEVEARSGQEIKVDKSESQAQSHIVTKELKDQALKRSLQRTRKQLPVLDKALSKAIHQPVIDALSKVGEKTVVRPTGVLTGSLVALVGTSYLLYTAKHYGFTYNYLVIFILFGGGYMIGLAIDLLIFAVKRARHSK